MTACKRWVLSVVLAASTGLAGCSMASTVTYGGAEVVAADSAAPAAVTALPPLPAPAPGVGDVPAATPVVSATPPSTQPLADGREVKRLVIYDAALQLVVADVARTLDAVRHAAEHLGGYLQEVEASAIVVRVPAARFDEALTSYERLGEVTQRHVKGQDITEEMRDLTIRLDNAQQVRQRLLALVDKSQKVEDTLKIEAELERLTQTIETLKGKIQFMQSQIAFSTIKVTVNSPLPQKQLTAQLPFAWVRDLGDGLVTGTAENHPDTSRWHSRAVRFTLPPSYIRYYERDQVAEAMSAEGVLIKVKRQDNYDGGDLAFWAALTRKALVEGRSLAVERETDLQMKNKAPARLIVGTRDISGKQQGYLLVLVVTERYVHTFEAWGPVEAFGKDRGALEGAGASLDTGS